MIIEKKGTPIEIEIRGHLIFFFLIFISVLASNEITCAAYPGECVVIAKNGLGVHILTSEGNWDKWAFDYDAGAFVVTDTKKTNRVWTGITYHVYFWEPNYGWMHHTTFNWNQYSINLMDYDVLDLEPPLYVSELPSGCFDRQTNLGGQTELPGDCGY